MKKHNKRRSTGIVYELLLQEAAEALVNGDVPRSERVIDLIKRHFRPGTELYKEARLFGALARTNASSRAVAETILNEAKTAAQNVKLKKLDSEKTALIHEISHVCNPNVFYQRRVPQYRTLATVQILMDDWRVNDVSSLAKRAEYEQSVIQWLTENKSIPTLESHTDSNVDPLVLKLMERKVKEKLSASLSQTQCKIVDNYVLSDKSVIEKTLTEIKSSAVALLTEESKRSEEQQIKDVLASVKELPTDFNQINDKVIERYMDVAVLIDTMKER